MKSKIAYLKQELISIPIFILIVEGCRMLIMHFSPETPLFDAASEFETFLVKVWQFTWLSMACWLILKLVFPKLHQYAIYMLNDGFDKIPKQQKRYITLAIYITFLIGLILLFNGAKAQPTQNIINERYTEITLRKQLINYLKSQLHVRELTGNNDGVEIEKYLAYVGHKKGASWCAAFCSYAYGQFDIPNPKSAWSPAFALAKDRTNQYRPGDCFTLYYNYLGRVGHVGFITGFSHGYYTTIEGNTGTSGSREGSGVHTYLRDTRKVYAVTNYISKLYK